MYSHPNAVFRQRPEGHTFLCKFWHFQMAVSNAYYWVYLQFAIVNL